MPKRRKTKLHPRKTKYRPRKSARALADDALISGYTYQTSRMRRRRILASPKVRSKTPKQVIRAVVREVMADLTVESNKAEDNKAE